MPFILMHVACIAVFFVRPHPVDIVLAVTFFCLRMFSLTAGYHRYFSHRSYKTSRVFQFLIGWMGCCAVQKGPLWWCAHHRGHHKNSDNELDVHSPITKSIWEAHVGWILEKDNDATRWENIPDWQRYPELVWLNNWHIIPAVLFGGFCFAVSYFCGGTGWSGVVYAFVLATVLLYHSTFLVNSLAHLAGSRRYETDDRSRNNWLVAILTMGEGWHNNHHHYQAACRQGFFWWEVDVTYYVLTMLSWVGIVWDLKQPPKSMLQKVKGSNIDSSNPNPLPTSNS